MAQTPLGWGRAEVGWEVIWNGWTEHMFQLLSTDVVGPGWTLEPPECSGWVDAAMVAFICPGHQLTTLEPQLDLFLGSSMESLV